MSVDSTAIAKAAYELEGHVPVEKRGSATVCACGTWYNTMLDPRAAELHAMRKALEAAAPYIGSDALTTYAEKVPHSLSDQNREFVANWLYEQAEELRPPSVAQE